MRSANARSRRRRWVLALAALTASGVAKDTKRCPGQAAFRRGHDCRAPRLTRSIGGYAKGCLAGAVALPLDGPNWQVMRLSRNRHWGNPELVDYLEKFADRRRKRRLAGSPRRRHVAAARRADADRPRQPPDRPRRRHLVRADAGLHALRRGAREEVGGVAVDERALAVDPRKWSNVYAAASEARRLLSGGGARLRQRRDQEGAMRQRPAPTAPGCARSGRGGATTIISMCGSTVRRACAGCAAQAPAPPGDGCGAELDVWFKPPPEAAEARKPVKPKLRRRN